MSEDFDMASDMAHKLFATCESAGLKVYSDDICCQALAWCYVYGGGNEQVLYGKIRNAILCGQYRLNLHGGEIPNVELLPMLQKYIKSIEDIHNPPKWVLDLEKRFEIKMSH
ncbi:MAG: hypothetical protein LBQ76_08600 [Candidatus Fibromonas sp.]|nr:hypothetical protein [Candidatus Fibromonas sp.]